MACEHNDIEIHTDFARVLKDGTETVAYYSATINIKCKDCKQPFEFVGLPLGCSPYRPTVSLDGHDLSVPGVFGGMKIPEGLASISVKMEDGLQ